MLQAVQDLQIPFRRSNPTMKQLWKTFVPLRFLLKCNIFAPFTFSLAQTLNYYLFPHGLHTQSHSSSSPSPSLSSFSLLPNIIELFSNKPSNHDLLVRSIMQRKVTKVRHELIQNSEDSDKIVKKLEDSEDLLLQKHADGSSFVELLKQLDSQPRLALEVSLILCTLRKLLHVLFLNCMLMWGLLSLYCSPH